MVLPGSLCHQNTSSYRISRLFRLTFVHTQPLGSSGVKSVAAVDDRSRLTSPALGLLVRMSSIFSIFTSASTTSPSSSSRPARPSHPSGSITSPTSPNSSTPSSNTTTQQQRTAEARAAFDASLAATGQSLDHELHARATNIHENAKKLDEQDEKVSQGTEGLREEVDGLERELKRAREALEGDGEGSKGIADEFEDEIARIEAELDDLDGLLDEAEGLGRREGEEEDEGRSDRNEESLSTGKGLNVLPGDVKGKDIKPEVKGSSLQGQQAGHVDTERR